jgi:hypothetical protein
MIPIAKSSEEYQAYRISPDSSNKLAITFDLVTYLVKQSISQTREQGNKKLIPLIDAS